MRKEEPVLIHTATGSLQSYRSPTTGSRSKYTGDFRFQTQALRDRHHAEALTGSSEAIKGQYEGLDSIIAGRDTAKFVEELV